MACWRSWRWRRRGLASWSIPVRVSTYGSASRHPVGTRANPLTLYVTGVNVREEEILPGTNAGVKWEATWRLRKPSHDVHLVAIAQGPGIAAPYWPTARPLSADGQLTLRRMCWG